MKTLEITDFDSGTVIDRIHLSPDGKLTYDTGAGESLIRTLTIQGMSESEAFELRTGWSNGYLVAKLT